MKLMILKSIYCHEKSFHVLLNLKCRFQSKIYSMILCFKYITYISADVCVASGEKHAPTRSFFPLVDGIMHDFIFFLCLLDIHYSYNPEKNK